MQTAFLKPVAFAYEAFGTVPVDGVAEFLFRDYDKQPCGNIAVGRGTGFPIYDIRVREKTFTVCE